MVKTHRYASVMLTCLLVAAVPRAQEGADGTWRLTVEFHNGRQPASLLIKTSGRQVTGTFTAPFAGGEVPIEGEMGGRRLTFSAATTGGPHPGLQIDFNTTLRDDGTLAGTMSMTFGEFKFTGERTD
jgi:hypothetical protein